MSRRKFLGETGCLGVLAYYHSPIQPQPPSRGCHGWATWSNFVCDSDLHVTGYTEV